MLSTTRAGFAIRLRAPTALLRSLAVIRGGWIELLMARLDRIDAERPNRFPLRRIAR